MAISIINHTTSTGSGSGNTKIVTVNSTGSQLIIVGVQCNTTVTPTVTDGVNTYLVGYSNTIDSSQGTYIYYCVNPTNSITLAVTVVAGSGLSTTVTCVNGFVGTPTLNSSKNRANITTVGATSMTTGSVTPSFTNNIVVTCWGMNEFSASGTLSINSSFTPLDTIRGAGWSVIGTSYLIQTSNTSQNPTWSTTNSITHAACVIVVFDDLIATTNKSNFFMFF